MQKPKSTLKAGSCWLRRVVRRRYRIVKETCGNNVFFTPQERFWWCPIWSSWTTSATGYDFSNVWFPTEEEAKAFIESERREIKVTKEIIAA